MTPMLRVNFTTKWSRQMSWLTVCRGLRIQSQVTSTPFLLAQLPEAQEGSAVFQHSSLALSTEWPSLDSGTWHQPDLHSSHAVPGQLHLPSVRLPTIPLESIYRPDVQADLHRHPDTAPLHQPGLRETQATGGPGCWPHSPLADDDNDGPQEEDEDSKSPCTDAQDEAHLLRPLRHLQGPLTFLAGSFPGDSDAVQPGFPF